MKENEFFERAFEDASYRREKLEELRYIKKVSIVVSCIIAAVGVAVTVYTTVNGERWDSHIFQWLLQIVVCAMGYSTCVTRIAALEVFERGSSRTQNHPAGGSP